MAMAKRVGSTMVLGCVLALLPFVSCGSDPAELPVVMVTPQPVVAHLTNPPATIPSFPNDTWVPIPISLSQRGSLEMIVEWSSPESWIFVYFGQTQCDLPMLTAHVCPFLMRSETQLPKPRVLLTGVLEPARYYLYLYNVPRNRDLGIGSVNDERAAVDIWLTIPPSNVRPPVEGGPTAVVLAPER
jgi:hypothetical protein